MKRFFCWLLFASLLTVQTQAQPLNARQVESKGQALREVLPLSLTRYLDDPDVVLVIANLQPEYQFFVESMKADEQTTAKVYGANGSQDLIIIQEDTRLTFRSVPALKKQAQSIDMNWVFAVPSELTAKGWDDWSTEQGNLARLRQPDLSYTLVSDFMLGAPKSVFETTLLSANNPVDEARQLSFELSYGNLYDGSQLNFRVLPEFVDSEDFRGWLSSRIDLLTAFYDLPSVRERQRSRAWVNSRSQARENTSALREQWLRGEYDAIRINDIDSPAVQELVLVNHVDELVALVRSGAFPDQWARKLTAWSAQEGLAVPVDLDLCNTWIWMGAYGKSEARKKLSLAVEQTLPNYFPSMTKAKLQDWLEFESSKENSVPDFYDVDYVVKTFSHPKVKQAYQNLSVAERSKFEDRLRVYRKTEKVAPLITAAPYNL